MRHLVPVRLHVDRPLVSVSVLLSLLPEVPSDISEHDGFHDCHPLSDTRHTYTHTHFTNGFQWSKWSRLHFRYLYSPPGIWTKFSHLLEHSTAGNSDVYRAVHSRRIVWLHGVLPRLITRPFMRLSSRVQLSNCRPNKSRKCNLFFVSSVRRSEHTNVPEDDD